MSDLIDRQELIAEINRIGGHPYSDWETAGVLRMAYRIPTVDAVPVVRCRDCRYVSLTRYGTYICEACINRNVVGLNHFCSYGERRDDNATDVC